MDSRSKQEFKFPVLGIRPLIPIEDYREAVSRTARWLGKPALALDRTGFQPQLYLGFNSSEP